MLSHVVSSFSGGLPTPDGLSTVVVMDGAAGLGEGTAAAGSLPCWQW